VLKLIGDGILAIFAAADRARACAAALAAATAARSQVAALNLRRARWAPTHAKSPRFFCLDPAAKILYAANADEGYGD